MQPFILSLDTVLVCTAAEQITPNLAAHSSKQELVFSGSGSQGGSGVSEGINQVAIQGCVVGGLAGSMAHPQGC